MYKLNKRMGKNILSLAIIVCLLISGISYHSNTVDLLNSRLLENNTEIKLKEETYLNKINELDTKYHFSKFTLSQKENCLKQLPKIIEKLEVEHNKCLVLENEVSKLKEQIKKYENQITSKDHPDLKDTSKISRIDIDVVNQKFKGGVLHGQGELIVNIAKEYSISPHFFCALIALESNYGKSKLAHKKNNLGGIKKSRNSYKTFDSTKDCLVYMAVLIKENYHAKGRITIDSIGKKYAPSWDASTNTRWAKNIRSIMKEIHFDALS